MYAGLQAKRHVVFNKWIECNSDDVRFLPSHTFSIHDHKRSDVNGKCWIVSVSQQGEQPGVLEHEAPDRPVSQRS
jgi:type VI secretion system secreted protein VgrG